MKRITKLTTLLVVCLILLLVATCNFKTKAEKKRMTAVGRFDVIKKFYLLDGLYKLYPNTGEIWKDRITGKCYLHIWGGAGNGGPALTKFDCN